MPVPSICYLPPAEASPATEVLLTETQIVNFIETYCFSFREIKNIHTLAGANLSMCTENRAIAIEKAFAIDQLIIIPTWGKFSFIILCVLVLIRVSGDV